jgi:predicted nucleic acid-binding protein
MQTSLPALPWEPQYIKMPAPISCPGWSKVRFGLLLLTFLNEVFYALLVGKGSELLASTKISKIRQHLTRDIALSAACYKVCRDFWGYLSALQATGLRIVSVGAHEQDASLSLGSRYLLLPTDALHVATCQHHNVSHCATADVHFEKVDLLQVWKPAKR